uniref:Vacuolar fusion protein MON1 n=1 Tax=Mycena chlorophos TaxID=658473 RepID=A0ABQ0M9Y6_MYCCL|nr:predicted protein [Mycena chlorophos]
MSSRKPSSGRSPTRLAIPPALRPSPSLSNLRVHSYSGTLTTDSDPIPPVPPLPIPAPLRNATLDSTASSVVNLDLTTGDGGAGILVQDVDGPSSETATTVDGDDNDSMSVTAVGVVNASASDEASKRSLRDQLRRTLTHKPSRPDMPTQATRSSWRKGKHLPLHEIAAEPGSRYAPREYFVLTDAGKPVFTSRPGGEDSESMTSMIGIMQALISVYIDDGDKIKCINAGNTRITFVLRPPLYYVCASSWGEPESIEGTLTSRVPPPPDPEHRYWRLLNGAESFLTSLISRLEFDLAMATASLHCLRLDAAVRKRAAEAMVPTSKMKDVLYVVLVARGRVISLVRPKKHSIHPADIHILLNTIHAPSILNSPASASWIPVCLPKFNHSGFVNAYISFPRKDDGLQVQTPAPAAETPATSVSLSLSRPLDSGIALVCISAGGGTSDFESIRTWCDGVTSKLEREGTLDVVVNAFRAGETEYSVAELGIPGLRHFVYKSRAQVQITAPAWEEPYDVLDERRRLTTLYQIVYDAIHAKSGQEATLKLQYLRSEKESVMGWITQPFELYITLSPRLPKSAAVGAANAVARWVKKEEARLFLRDAPVF